MSNKNKKLVCFIGRLQPYTVAHHAALTKALEVGDHVLLILGSAFAPITPKNPWTVEERTEMVRANFSEEDNARLTIRGVADTLYDDMEWVADVTHEMQTVKESRGMDSVALLAHIKDDSTYYVNYFKFLEIIDFDGISEKSVDVEAIGPTAQILLEEDGTDKISATTIRELLFNGVPVENLPFLLEASKKYLSKWVVGKNAQYVQEEYDAYVNEAEKFIGTPYGVHNFYTADSVVIQSGYVLMIQRRDAPGRGLWALPGGHVNKNEDSFTASLRELREETKIKVPLRTIVGSLYSEKVFDHPKRSLRNQIGGFSNGRSITTMFAYKLDDSLDLPKIKASDDAAKGKWIKITDLKAMRHLIFEDHYSIIQYAVARIPANRRIPNFDN